MCVFKKVCVCVRVCVTHSLTHTHTHTHSYFKELVAKEQDPSLLKLPSDLCLLNVSARV